MKFLKKATAGFLVSAGFLFTMVSLSQIPKLTNEDVSREEKNNAIEILFVGLGFSLPMSTGGGIIFWRLREKNQQKISDRLNSVFYKLIKNNQGRVTIIELAMEARISGEEAKKYLDTKAKEFNAYFESNERGNVNYHFEVSADKLEIKGQLDNNQWL